MLPGNTPYRIPTAFRTAPPLVLTFSFYADKGKVVQLIILRNRPSAPTSRNQSQDT
jgi:hypothetical protein